MNPQQQIVMLKKICGKDCEGGLQFDPNKLAKVLSELDERLLKVEGEKPLIEDCPNCKNPDPDIPTINGGKCGVCSGTGKIEWKMVGKIETVTEDPYLKALDDVLGQLPSVLVTSSPLYRNVKRVINDLRKAHE